MKKRKNIKHELAKRAKELGIPVQKHWSISKIVGHTHYLGIQVGGRR